MKNKEEVGKKMMKNVKSKRAGITTSSLYLLTH